MSSQNQTAPMVQLTGDNRLTTTSLAIAEHFNRNHKDVIKAINRLDCSSEFNQRNFAPVEYKDAKGEARPAYEITRDGFVFLAMGFTGRQAAVWKERYILAFNRLEQELINRQIAEIPEFAKKALLKANPVWNSILHYKNIGLNNTEIAKLLDYKSPSAITSNLRKMEALNLIEPPKNLAQLQEMGRKNRFSAIAKQQKSDLIEFITEVEA